ncbi:MAG: hypothetical protein ACRDT4_18670 [Micromonosporaceae bacterium]
MSDTDDMNYGDFVDSGTDLINGMLDRIPERWRDGFVEDIEDGIQEPKIFMTDLVLILERDQVPITQAERDTVVRLMKHRKMDLAPVERFNVTESMPSRESSGEQPEV